MKFSDLQLETPYLGLESIFYDEVDPTPLHKPFLISTSNEAGKLLGIDEDLFEDEKLVHIVNGREKLSGSTTFSMTYAGHQFGYFVPRLGDGRAINLGKVNGQNLQLKGSGLTLYSRQGDGRAVLRSSIREYLMSEAMHGLGIATTRALALIGSDTDVARGEWEKGAIVLRLSPTWVRFGTFEYFYAGKEFDKIQQLADYVIDESFPELKNEEGMYLKMFAQIVKNTAITLAKWQVYGFNHGVMNTDNMSIDGRTIDYGPSAFLDDYQSDYVCNHTDREGRYSYENQPGIAHWNLNRLAIALSPIINYDASKVVLEDVFGPAYEREYLSLMYQRFGLFESHEEDYQLLLTTLQSMEDAQIDYNEFFRALSHYDGDKTEILSLAKFPKMLEKFFDSYDARLKKEGVSDQERQQKMLTINPKYILRNYVLQLAIDKAKQNDFTMVNDLLKVAHEPFDEHPELEYLAIRTPDSAKNIKLSCSS